MSHSIPPPPKWLILHQVELFARRRATTTAIQKGYRIKYDKSNLHGRNGEFKLREEK